MNFIQATNPGVPFMRSSIAYGWAFAKRTALLTLCTTALAQSKPNASPEQKYFQYQRSISIEQGTGTACALLTPEVFAHAAPSLADLRVYSANKNGKQEIPYATTLSEPSTASESARILNLGMRAGHIVFDLEMPDRPYTEVNLDLLGTNFLATARVEGSTALTGSPSTKLGDFIVFNFESQHLSHSTTLNLQESTFRYLHIDLAFAPTPGTGTATSINTTMVQGAEVPPSREAQTLYTSIASATSQPDPEHHRTTATFHVPAHVPVEQVSFVLAPGFKTNFSRRIVVTAKADAPETNEVRTNLHRDSNEEVLGEISHVDITRAGKAIHESALSIPATLGINMQQGATVTVIIEDGDDRPLELASVQLEMRERKLCFDPPADAPTLFYGDAALHAPVYDFARLFVPTATPRPARLENEQPNPLFTPRADARAFTERHPDLLWVALLLVIGILAVVALRSTRQMHHKA
jgi:hypothetical protein